MAVHIARRLRVITTIVIAAFIAAQVAACEASRSDDDGSTTNTPPDASADGAPAAPVVVSPSDDDDAGADAALPTVEPLHVLFIGNSLTYVNDLPRNVHDLAAVIAASTRGAPGIDVESETLGAATFQTHWTATNAQTQIAKGNHSHVVLQGQSSEPIDNPAGFTQYGTLLVNAATAAGAKAVLYQTWAYKGGNPEAMQNGLTAAYAKLAQDTGASIAPVGEAWRIARTEHPAIELHQPDGVHPTAAGTYLAACVFTIVLTGRPLATVSNAIPLPPGVAQADAPVLQTIATRVTATK